MTEPRAGQVPRDKVYGNFRKSKYDAVNAPRAWKRARDGRPGMSAEHLASVRKLPCMVCGTTKIIHAHHLRSQHVATLRGVGLKAPDRYSVPLCAIHHNDIHSIGSRKERSWVMQLCGIDPYTLSDSLWNVSPCPQKMYRVLLAHQLAASSALLERARR